MAGLSSILWGILYLSLSLYLHLYLYLHLHLHLSLYPMSIYLYLNQSNEFRLPAKSQLPGRFRAEPAVVQRPLPQRRLGYRCGALEAPGT